MISGVPDRETLARLAWETWSAAAIHHAAGEKPLAWDSLAEQAKEPYRVMAGKVAEMVSEALVGAGFEECSSCRKTVMIRGASGIRPERTHFSAILCDVCQESETKT